MNRIVNGLTQWGRLRAGAFSRSLRFPKRRGRLELEGPICELSVPDLVQILDLTRKTGTVRLESKDARGTLYLQEGSVIDAEMGELRGLEAANRLLCMTEGSFEVDFHPVTRERTILDSTTSLLVSALTASDEAARRSELRHATDDLRLFSIDLPQEDAREIEAWQAIGTDEPDGSDRQRTLVPRPKPGRAPAFFLLAAISLAGTLGIWGLGPSAEERQVSGPSPSTARAVPLAAPTSAQPQVVAASPTLPLRSLDVYSTPPGARILVNQRFKGRTPGRIPVEDAQTLDLRLVHEAFDDFVTTVTVDTLWRGEQESGVRILRARLHRRAPSDAPQATTEQATPENAQPQGPHAAPPPDPTAASVDPPLAAALQPADPGT